MSYFLTYAYLFFLGSVFGWALEVVFRKFFSGSNPSHKWINTGFCIGPYLPLYGFGLCVLFTFASIEKYIPIKNIYLEKSVFFLTILVSMTLLEYIAGLLMLKVFKVRLWDYSDNKGNIQGLICPLFSFFWGILGVTYYYLVNPYILNALIWLSNNLAFSFVIGLFFGVFIIDVVHSGNIISKLHQFADEHDVIIKYEALKSQIHEKQEHLNNKIRFFFIFRDVPLLDHLKEALGTFEKRIKKH